MEISGKSNGQPGFDIGPGLMKERLSMALTPFGRRGGDSVRFVDEVSLADYPSYRSLRIEQPLATPYPEYFEIRSAVREYAEKAAKWCFGKIDELLLDPNSTSNKVVRLSPKGWAAKDDVGLFDYRELIHSVGGKLFVESLYTLTPLFDSAHLPSGLRRKLIRAGGFQSPNYQSAIGHNFLPIYRFAGYPSYLLSEANDRAAILIDNPQVEAQGSPDGPVLSCSANFKIKLPRKSVTVIFCPDTPQGWADYQKDLLSRMLPTQQPAVAPVKKSRRL